MLFTSTGHGCNPEGLWRETCAEDHQKSVSMRHHVNLPPICFSISSIATGQCNLNLPTLHLLHPSPDRPGWDYICKPNNNALWPLAALFDADHQTLLYCLLTPLSVFKVVLQAVNDYCSLKLFGYGMMNLFLELPPYRKREWEKNS